MVLFSVSTFSKCTEICSCGDISHWLVSIIYSLLTKLVLSDNLALLSDLPVFSITSVGHDITIGRSCMLLIVSTTSTMSEYRFKISKHSPVFPISVKSSERLFGNTHYDLRLLLLQCQGIKILHIPTSWNVLTVIWGMSALLLDVLFVMYVGLSQIRGVHSTVKPVDKNRAQGRRGIRQTKLWIHTWFVNRIHLLLVKSNFLKTKMNLIFQ